MARTLSDLTRLLRAYVGNDTSPEKSAHVRTAALAGVRLLPTYDDWVYYQTIGRIVTTPRYTTGTVEYTASTRTMTLTDGTWPTWAANGSVQIADTSYDVQSRTSGTELVIAAASDPGADIDSSDYVLYRNRYPMPTDFASAGPPMRMNECDMRLVTNLEYVSQRTENLNDGSPSVYTLTGNTRGGTDILLWPPPTEAQTLDFLYKRRPAEPQIEEESTGKVTTDGTTAVTGIGTGFTSAMVGCVFRASATADRPTDAGGVNPAAAEALVTAVASPTALTLDAAVAAAAKVGYSVSSVVDVDAGPMWDFLLAACRKQLRISCRINMTNEELADYESAKSAARSANGQKTRVRRVAGMPGPIVDRGYPTDW